MNIETLLNNALLFGILAFQWYANRKANKASIDQKENHQKIVEVAVKQEEVAVKQDTLIKKVGHPLGLSLDTAATALEKVARMTKDENDIMAAVLARRASQQHNKEQMEMDAAKALAEKDKAKIIAEFLAGKTAENGVKIVPLKE